MRVLIVTTSQYIAFHGQAIFTINLAEGLARNGHTVTALSASETGKAYHSERKGVSIEAVNSVNLRMFHPETYLPLFPNWAVRHVFETFQPDIIHIQDHYSLCRSAAITAHRLGVKSVGTNHFMPENLAPYFPGISSLKPVFNWVLWTWMKETFNRLDAIACPSRTAAGMLGSIGLKPPVIPISCGANIVIFHTDPIVDRAAWRKRYGIHPDQTVFFFVGRVDREKRLDVLLRAMKLLNRDDIQLVIGGKGADKDRLTTLARQLELGGKVHFTGFIPQEDLPAVLNSIDVFTIASEAELLSIATLQAMGCSRPVLAADSIALPELVDSDVNGFLFKPGDPADVAKHMAWFADHPERWPGMGRASLEKVQSHSLEVIVHDYELFYEQVLQPASRSVHDLAA